MVSQFDENIPTPALGVPEKFLESGEVLPYPGNTTICHIPKASPLLPHLHRVYDAYLHHPTLSSYIRLLPPESWHMTVLDGVRERECEPGMWPDDVPKKPLPEATEEFGVRLKAFGKSMGAEGLEAPYRMRVVGFEPTQCGMGLEVAGADDAEEKRLRRLRDRLAQTLGVRAPNHERYCFHITVAYLLKTLVGRRKRDMIELLDQLLQGLQGVEFQLGAVEFCLFDDMTCFHRLFFLSEH